MVEILDFLFPKAREGGWAKIFVPFFLHFFKYNNYFYSRESAAKRIFKHQEVVDVHRGVFIFERPICSQRNTMKADNEARLAY